MSYCSVAPCVKRSGERATRCPYTGHLVQNSVRCLGRVPSRNRQSLARLIRAAPAFASEAKHRTDITVVDRLACRADASRHRPPREAI